MGIEMFEIDYIAFVASRAPLMKLIADVCMMDTWLSRCCILFALS